MFLMRRAKIEDVATLHKLARMVHFINLPADRDIIADKALWSRQCFLKAAQKSGIKPSAKHPAPRPAEPADNRQVDRGAGPLHAGAKGDPAGLAGAVSRSDLFMFVLEDLESKGVLGTSQIIAQMGGPGRPNVSLRLTRKEMFSRSLQLGATHMVARLHLDESGPTEIGGLILQPSYRGHKAKLGRFLSLVRFHFMGLHPQFFSPRVIAELMAPVTPDGRSTLWEYLGRRFINLSYAEADSFCQYSKEFITALFPREDIYLSLLPPEARAVVAQVGPETAPARGMLEKLGFAYRDLIDPFDGGPTLEAKTREISVVRATNRLLLGDPVVPGEAAGSAIVSTLDANGDFLAVQTAFATDGKGRTRIPADAMAALGAEPGMKVGFTALEPHEQAAHDKSAKGESKRARKNGAPARRKQPAM